MPIKDKKLIILDLDETLIHNCSEWIGRKPDFIAANQMVYIRPFATEFIKFVFEHYDVAIWSAASGGYFTQVVDHLFPYLRSTIFAWDRELCEPMNEGQQVHFLKDCVRLQSLNYLPHNIYILDDKPELVINISTESIIPIKPYWGSNDDSELASIIKQLKLIE